MSATEGRALLSMSMVLYHFLYTTQCEYPLVMPKVVLHNLMKKTIANPMIINRFSTQKSKLQMSTKVTMNEFHS